MPTLISEPPFLNPSGLENIPCVAASRFLETAPESVMVNRVCQDEQNPSLVEVSYTLVGYSIFEPHLDILEVDNRVLAPTIEAPLAIGNRKNIPVPPINSNCSSINGTVVFDFSDAVAGFLGVQVIKFRLRMIGSLPPSAAVALGYSSTTATNVFTWTKGQLPKPLSMNYLNGQLSVLFQYGAKIDCSCNIQCIVPSGVQQQVTFCANQTQTVIVAAGPLTGDPSSFIISFNNAIGNTSTLTVQSLINVIPRSPVVINFKDPRRVEIGIDRRAQNGEILEDVAYQIWKYEGVEANAKILYDWNHRSWQSFIDKDVIAGRNYGYSVRYKGQYQDESSLAPWATVTVSDP